MLLLPVMGVLFVLFIYNNITSLEVKSLSNSEIKMGMTLEETNSLFKKYQMSFNCNQDYADKLPNHTFGENMTYRYCKGTYKTGRGVYLNIHKSYYIFGNNKLKMMVETR